MKQVVNSFIKKHSLLIEGTTIVVGVSGGPDSLALLHFLKKQEESMNIKIVAAHVDHMLRGDESLDDFLFVENYCSNQGIPFEGTRINVLAYKEKHKLSSQVAARECRYCFFRQVLQKYNSQFLALAHHGDDQVETMVMRQIRGAQGFALAGMAVKRPFENGFIIRPFLCVSKDEIIQYCLEENLTPRIDKSNFSSKYLRNRVRNEILPILKKENPSVHIRFQQQSELMLDDELFLEQLAKTHLHNAIIYKETKKAVLSISKLILSPIPLQRRAFQLILKYLYEQYMPEITTLHIEQFLLFIKNNHPSGSLDFPNGLKIVKSYDQCFLSFDLYQEVNNYEYQLPIPGIVTVKKGKIIGEVMEEFPEQKLNKNVIICDFEKLSLPLIIRNRKQGDSIVLQGMKGTKKLKTLFIDEKIHRQDRDEWPIVVNSNGEIVWVPGLRRSNIALPTSETKKYLVLHFKGGFTIT